MNKKIKIIEIFNIISNGEYEKLPLNIKVDGKKYNWDTLEHFYNRKDSDREDLLELAREYDTITFLDMIAEVLDDSIEEITFVENKIKNTRRVFEEVGRYLFFDEDLCKAIEHILSDYKRVLKEEEIKKLHDETIEENRKNKNIKI